MHSKVLEIIDKLKGIEEKAYIVGFDSDDARQHAYLLKELKSACEGNSVDCIEAVKALPLAKLDQVTLRISS